MGLRVSLWCLVVLSLAGCGDDTAALGVAGKWTVDTERVRADFIRDLDGKAAVAAEADKPMFEKRKAEFLAKMDGFVMQLDIAADKTYVGRMEGAGDKRTTKGTWKAVQGGWRLITTHENGAPVDKPRVINLRMEGDQLVGGQVPEHTFHFNRN